MELGARNRREKDPIEPLRGHRDEKYGACFPHYRESSKSDRLLRGEILEGLQLEAESMLDRPFVLDGVRFGDAEQTFADHGDHEVLCGKDPDSPIRTPCLNDGSAVVNREDVLSMDHDSDCGAFTCSEAPGRRQQCEE